MKINPQAVELARQSRGLSQTDLATKLEISQSKLSKVELGQQDAPDEVFQRLVRALHYPAEFFAQPFVSTAKTTEFFNYRKKASVRVRYQEMVEARSNITRLQIRKLLESVEIPSRLETFDIETSIASPEAVANHIRAKWSIPAGPIQNLVKVLEDAGIIIVWFEFENPEISGFTIQDDSNHPIIFLNRNMPGDRDRFTLAHELGHILLHKFPTDNSESEANKFASEFLMPKRDISGMLYPVNLDRLAALKMYWKVSMQALLMRASDLNLVTKRQAQFTWMKMGKLGYRTQEPLTLNIPKERPTLLRELIDVHKTELGFSKEEICRRLYIFEDEFEKVYEEDTKPFKVVIRSKTA